MADLAGAEDLNAVDQDQDQHVKANAMKEETRAVIE